MERIIKEVGPSILDVKDILKSLNESSEDYLNNAKVAVSSYQALLDIDKDKIMKDILLKYKYFDALKAVKHEESVKNSKPVIKHLLSLNSNSNIYNQHSKLALKMVGELTPAETAIVLNNKGAKAKLSEAKAYSVGSIFLGLEPKLGTYFSSASVALKEYNNLYPDEKALLIGNKKAYKAYSLAVVNTIKGLLMKFDTSSENHSFIGRDALRGFEDLSEENKNHILESEFYKGKINKIQMFFDKIESDALIVKLHNLYMASIQSDLTSDYFTYALKIIDEFEGLTTGARLLVEAEAAFELQVAKDGKAAHPVVNLTETFLGEKKHSKYYEIADILVSAYEFSLTKRQKRYFNKSTYTMGLINEAKEDIRIKVEAI